jgi:hypothetical protein
MAETPKTVRQPASQDMEREAANREGEAGRKKMEKSRQANAVKQKRYRESMKAQGCRVVQTWEKPLPPGMVKVSALIHKSSLGIAGQEDSAAGTLVRHLRAEAFTAYQKGKITKALCRDIASLLEPPGERTV